MSSAVAVLIAKLYLTNNNRNETLNSLKKFNNKNNEDYHITLNIFIFKQLSIYLAYNKSFKEILELSLLSKSTFKIFQNLLISKEFNKNKFILKLNSFMNYIKSSSDNNKESSYANKLIQYKELVRIRINYNEIPNKLQIRLKTIKEFMNINCPEMKQIAFLDYIEPFDYKTTVDFTCDSFFKVKKLHLYWDAVTSYPISHDDEDDDDLDYDDALDYQYTFSFLDYYKPSKIIIQTDCYKYRSSLECLDCILNCKSIKKIKFDANSTPESFIQELIEEDQIKSLTVEHSLNELSNIKKLLETTQVLRKLVFSNFEKIDNKETKLKLPSILESLKINSNHSKLPITKLGLQAFTIDQSNQEILLPLLDLPNIYTLYCNCDSLTSILEHCSKNQYIQRLIIDDFDISGEALIKIHQFVLKLPKTSSLQSIVAYEQFNNHENYSNQNKYLPIIKNKFRYEDSTLLKSKTLDYKI